MMPVCGSPRRRSSGAIAATMRAPSVGSARATSTIAPAQGRIFTGPALAGRLVGVREIAGS